MISHHIDSNEIAFIAARGGKPECRDQSPFTIQDTTGDKIGNKTIVTVWQALTSLPILYTANCYYSVAYMRVQTLSDLKIDKYVLK